MPSIKKLLITSGLLLLLAAPAMSVKAATGIDQLKQNTQNFGKSTGLAGAKEEDLKTKIASIINIVLSFLGIIAVVMIVYSGFRWMMAGGNEDTVREAKNTLKNAVIGLAIIFLAYGITYFVVNQLSRATTGGGSGQAQGESQP